MGIRVQVEVDCPHCGKLVERELHDGSDDPVRQAATSPAASQIDSACLSFRHDFGLMSAAQKRHLRYNAGEWFHAWQKAQS